MPIRPMRESDLGAVLGVIAFHDEEDAEAALDYFREAYEEDDRLHRHFVYLGPRREILGVGGAMPDDEEGHGIWWLGWFYVHPEARSQGIGRLLMQASLRWAKGHRGRKIYVDVSALPMYREARRFYRRHGFVEEGRLREFYNPGEDCILMGRTLGPLRRRPPRR